MTCPLLHDVSPGTPWFAHNTVHNKRTGRLIIMFDIKHATWAIHLMALTGAQQWGGWLLAGPGWAPMPRCDASHANAEWTTLFCPACAPQHGDDCPEIYHSQTARPGRQVACMQAKWSFRNRCLSSWPWQPSAPACRSAWRACRPPHTPAATHRLALFAVQACWL